MQVAVCQRARAPTREQGKAIETERGKKETEPRSTAAAAAAVVDDEGRDRRTLLDVALLLFQGVELLLLLRADVLGEVGPV